MRRIAMPLALVALAVLASPIGAAAQDQPTHGSYKIAPGDVLDIIVWRNKELTMTVTARPDGWISLPLLNDVRVSGMTPTELQKMLETGFAKAVSSPMVTVVVTKTAGFKVSILGKVRQPGRYDVEASATALDVLALAGGPTDYADTAQMYVLRRPERDGEPSQRIPVQYSSSASRDNTNNVQVKAGDIVIVP